MISEKLISKSINGINPRLYWDVKVENQEQEQGIVEGIFREVNNIIQIKMSRGKCGKGRYQSLMKERKRNIKAAMIE